jgi:hypothetical protein
MDGSRLSDSAAALLSFIHLRRRNFPQVKLKNDGTDDHSRAEGFRSGTTNVRHGI